MGGRVHRAGVPDEDDAVLDRVLAVCSAPINSVDEVDAPADGECLDNAEAHDCWLLAAGGWGGLKAN